MEVIIDGQKYVVDNAGETFPQYSMSDLLERIEYLKKGNFILSNQYGMLCLTNDANEIVLNISALVPRKDRMKHA